jgi:hypothetical protein
VSTSLGQHIFHALIQNSEIKGSVHHTNRRILKVAKEEVISKQQATRTSGLDNNMLVDLFDFTESFGSYAKEVMPPVRSDRHRSSQHTPTSPSRSKLSRAPPKRWRSEDFYSKTTSFQPKGSRNSQPMFSHPTISDVSAGSHSSGSRHSGTTSDPISRVSSNTPVSTTNNVRSANPANPGFIEPQDFRPREYINPPNQSILSHPAVMPRPRTIPLRQSCRIGRHTIVLDATHLHIDNHPLRFDMYATGNLFLQALLENQDKVDALVEALAMENEGDTWDGIPGWVVNAHGVTIRVERRSEI